jgi:YtkA-like
MATRIDDRTTKERSPLTRRPASQSTVVIIAVIAVVAVGLWLVVRAGGDGGGGRADAGRVVAGVDAAQTAAAASMQLVVAGIPQPLPASIPLTGDLAASVALANGDDSYARVVDLYLFREDDAGTGVDGATVRATVRMELMDHGTVHAEGAAGGGGHYQIPLSLEMAGDWQLEIEIVTPEEQATVVFSLAVWN